MYKLMNKIWTVILACSIALTCTTGWKLDAHADELSAESNENQTSGILSLPDDEAYWNGFGGNNTGTGTIESKTPTDLAAMQKVGFEIPGQIFDPMVVGDYLYTVTSINYKPYLAVYDQTGKEIKKTPLYSSVSFFSLRLAYGDGKIFVTLADRIQAFDATTLDSLWVTPKTSGQMISSITYHNGYIYSGVAMGASSNHTSDGYFFAVNTSDDDTATDEVKDYAWQTKEEKGKGYYWSGAVITKNAILFAGDGGELISHHLTRDITFDTIALNGNIRSNLTYLEDRNAVVAGSQDGRSITKIKLKEDGTFDRSTKVTNDTLGFEITGGIAYYRDRLYVASGGVSGGDLAIIDAHTLEPIYKVSGVNTQSYPLLTTAYATPENNYKVYIYVSKFEASYNKNGGLILLEDAQGQTEPVKQEFSENFSSANSGSIIGDANGNLYVYKGYNSGQKITIYKRADAAYHAADVENAIKRLPAKNDVQTSLSNTLPYHLQKDLQYTNLRYASLSVAEKSNVDIKQVTKLQELNTAVESNINEKILAIEKSISAIPEKISSTDIPVIEEIWNAYGMLKELDKAKISNVEYLKKAVAQISQLAASIEDIIKEIESLNLEEITLEDAKSLNELKSRFEKLSKVDQNQITNAEKLFTALDTLKKLQDQLLVPELITEIAKLPAFEKISLADEALILDVYGRYQALDKDVKKEITNADIVLHAYQEVTEQREKVTKLNDDIWEKLDPTNITLKDENNVKDFEARYLALSETNKTYIKYYADVQQAREILLSLQKGIIPSIVFENIKGTQKSYTYEGMMNSHSYTITFNGESVQEAFDFDAGLSMDSKDKEAILASYSNAYLIAMKQQGALPGAATLTMALPTVDGNYPLYLYDAKDNKATKVQDITVKNGKASFTITKGATYFVDIPKESRLPDTEDGKHQPGDVPATYDTTNIAAYAVLLIVALTGFYLIVRKRFTTIS